MIQKKKVLLYPFGKTTFPLLDMFRASDCYEICQIVSPSPWLSEGLDVGEINNRESFGIPVSNHFSGSLKLCDFVVFVSASEAMRQDILNKIEEAFQAKKHVLCFFALDKTKTEELKALAIQNKVSFCSGEDLSVPFNKAAQEQAENSYLGTTPLVGVGELIPGITANELLVRLHVCFTQRGYRCVTVSDDPNLILDSEFYQIPKEFFDDGLTDINKINFIQDYFECLAFTMQPDVILTKIPGGMMKYNDVLHNDFCIMPYLFSSALQFDYFILCALYEKIDPHYFEMINTNFYHKYDYAVDAIAMSNIQMNVNETNERKKFRCDYLPWQQAKQTIEQEYNNFDLPIQYLYAPETVNGLCDKIVEKLSGN